MNCSKVIPHRLHSSITTDKSISLIIMAHINHRYWQYAADRLTRHVPSIGNFTILATSEIGQSWSVKRISLLSPSLICSKMSAEGIFLMSCVMLLFNASTGKSLFILF